MLQLLKGEMNRLSAAGSKEDPDRARASSTEEPQLGAAAVFTSVERWALLAAFALIVIFRLPHAWAHGRFQDEEATVFLAYAWHHPWTDALFRPFGGYWNLAADATTLIVARLVQGGILPLELAPYLTMVTALAAQMLPAILILTGGAEWLARRAAVVAALLLIALMPATEEVFFNVLHIQFHLALCVALILAFDVPRHRSATIGYGVVLFLAPLCGPGAILLLPLFATRALADCEWRRLKQFGILGAGSAVQLLLFYGSSSSRGAFFDPPTLAAGLFVRLIALPLVGSRLTYEIGMRIYASRVAGGTFWWLFAGATLLLFATLLVMAAKRRDAAIWLTISALLIAAVSLGFGMVAGEHPFLSLFEPIDGERYNFLPLVLLGLALVVLAARPAFSGRFFCSSLCAIVLLTGTLYYSHPFYVVAEGPSWPREVAAWRRDHRHPLAVWPKPWAADLSDQARPCSPPSPMRPSVTEPRYCESGWAAGSHS